MNHEDQLELATQNIQAATDDRVASICKRLPKGESATHCVDCGLSIAQARRDALPGVQHCISCQEIEDQHGTHR
ncbi:TraR/DksA C4-type zinc finger protein [Neptunomonas antarctica]|uniref:Transcriptional regulator, TraR/DksA family n=1 Tax=Neptunomonas antarctica TaxID=619304 RepID=A0A1N7MQG6_9GAMM|nr:TraR/DksA C4-type zinc finger protein [Neptunomonas antarctica]SIS88099.1 transcriptional regulator, TraR/DksA family [Neptunomonas antarctica]